MHCSIFPPGLIPVRGQISAVLIEFIWNNSIVGLWLQKCEVLTPLSF
jgi:hypothetical protein